MTLMIMPKAKNANKIFKIRSFIKLSFFWLKYFVDIFGRFFIGHRMKTK